MYEISLWNSDKLLKDQVIIDQGEHKIRIFFTILHPNVTLFTKQQKTTKIMLRFNLTKIFHEQGIIQVFKFVIQLYV